jgi:hypothetical protein
MFAQTHAFEQFDGIGVQDLLCALARKIELRGVTYLEDSWHRHNPPPALPNIHK